MVVRRAIPFLPPMLLGLADHNLSRPFPVECFRITGSDGQWHGSLPRAAASPVGAVGIDDGVAAAARAVAARPRPDRRRCR